jgi:hypothetical protein
LPKIVSIESLRARREESAAERAVANTKAERGPGATNAADPGAVATKTRETTGTESTGAAASSVAPASSEAISESERNEILDELRSELGDLPDVRLEKVIEARSRIARGYYDSERVRLDILGAMLEEERGPAPHVPPHAPAPVKSKSNRVAKSASSSGKPAASRKASSRSVSAGKKRPTKARDR